MAEWSFYLNRSTTLSASRPRAITLAFPPLGGQTAIGVAQSDHCRSQERHLHAPQWSFYLNRTTTLVANGPVSPPWSSPPWKAKLREGWLKVTMKLLRETHPRPLLVVLPRQNDHFERERPRAITLVFPPLGGQTAIGVAQSDQEALKRDT